MIYIVISLLMLVPFFFVLKWFLLSSQIHHNASGIMFAVAAIAFHMYIFRFDTIPIVNIAVSHSPIVFYGAIVIALLHALVYSVCFNLYYGKTKHEEQ
ncbi:hypothetical protein HZS38_18770 [Xenorhabdus nematophila]|uniref:Uncharacterized protein n=1 Tax=Xenorhabdus nematophila (strain ATCC 19061 / DSM 3370 / CCUG 14189 / LMG 1036 / NCIMB 9965 / AN6) TaxID=406817 RepID=D3VB15_XENNA|nr:hypothetical protein [Xenorhabdus nematophila]CEE90543.1 hypothetical protein; putative membrane protein [Xenorhabdus nematophila str. Anatoliense]CEF28719.1 hypothetical protein; putative membrane protein [Xenorhabdus nematophila str. Websteri]AYA42346.1 hypothetical protein D3790_19530 [Xenorhabdus nematophila]KHD29191.1 hypothetical protein LH67_04840 [Xenorhabdus nematophila]MBA0021078.1 hypothetical protein [Xenorhabdus nematophila]